MKRFRRRIPLLIVVSALAALLVYGFRPVPVKVDAISVERGSFEITVDDDGETRIREKYIVTSPVAGKLLRVELHPGDAVSHGETLLAAIEPGDPIPLDARSRAEAEARIRGAEAARELASAQRKRADEALALAKHEYDRSRDLLRKQAGSQNDFDRAEHQFQMAQADVRSADFAVRVAEYEFEIAQAAMVDNSDAPDSRANVSTFPLVSPIDGFVLRVFTEDAGVVAAGTPIMELGDPRDLELQVDVLSTEAVRIKPGANVYIDHWGGDGILEGVVRVVEPAAFLKVSALGVEEKRVNIIADLRGPLESHESLGDGFRIEARIVLDRAEDVVKVSTGALFRHARAWHAFRIVDGRAQIQQVIVGRTNGLMTEIQEGLSPGDVVVLHPTDKVADGVRLHATFPADTPM